MYDVKPLDLDLSADRVPSRKHVRQDYGTFYSYIRGFPCVSTVVKHLWYFVKCALLPWRRYNRIKIDCLPPTWCDRSHLVPLAVFQILCDFVEREMFGMVDWEAAESHDSAARKIMEHYTWFHEVYLPGTDYYQGYRPWDSCWSPKLLRNVVGAYLCDDDLDEELCRRASEICKPELAMHLWT